MTLIEYILDCFDAAAYIAEKKGERFEITSQDLFDNESEASFAKSWDAELFSKKILKKDLKDASFREIYGSFKAISRHIELQNISYETLRNSEEEERKEDQNNIYQRYRNGMKKKNLIYNDNYEPSSEEDFD
ncbi:MAG: hypothetical protein J5970_02010 [Bacilli bacterium]|nr:hypothetical protein [Bacilli bacterium]